jgi:hypothetical protein
VQWMVGRHVRFPCELFLEALGLPPSGAGFPHPLRRTCSLDGIAGDLALVAVRGVWPFSHRRRMAEIERNLVSLEFRSGDGQFGGRGLAVDHGAAVVAECACQRAAFEFEFQSLRGETRRGVGAGYGYFPCTGRIDCRFLSSED